ESRGEVFRRPARKGYMADRSPSKEIGTIPALCAKGDGKVRLVVIGEPVDAAALPPYSFVTSRKPQRRGLWTSDGRRGPGNIGPAVLGGGGYFWLHFRRGHGVYSLLARRLPRAARRGGGARSWGHPVPLSP